MNTTENIKMTKQKISSGKHASKMCIVYIVYSENPHAANLL